MLQTATGPSPHIRLVASDVDGTLLNSRHKIAPRTVDAIRGIREKGVLFVPATGKSRGGVRNALGDLGRELTDPKTGLSVGGVYLQVRIEVCLVSVWVAGSVRLCALGVVGCMDGWIGWRRATDTRFIPQGLIVYRGEEVVFERTLEVRG